MHWYPAVDLQLLYDRKLDSFKSNIARIEKEKSVVDSDVAALEKRGVKVIGWSRKPAPIGLAGNELRLWYALIRSAELEEKLEAWNQSTTAHAQRGVRRICAIKFRSRNKFGAKEVETRVFETTGGRIKEIVHDPGVRYAANFDPGWLNRDAIKYLADPNYNVDSDPSVVTFSNLLGNTVKELERGRQPKPKNEK